MSEHGKIVKDHGVTLVVYDEFQDKVEAKRQELTERVGDEYQVVQVIEQPKPLIKLNRKAIRKQQAEKRAENRRKDHNERAAAYNENNGYDW
jgi:hypothetical protein